MRNQRTGCNQNRDTGASQRRRDRCPGRSGAEAPYHILPFLIKTRPTSASEHQPVPLETCSEPWIMDRLGPAASLVVDFAMKPFLFSRASIPVLASTCLGSECLLITLASHRIDSHDFVRALRSGSCCPWRLPHLPAGLCNRLGNVNEWAAPVFFSSAVLSPNETAGFLILK